MINYKRQSLCRPQLTSSPLVLSLEVINMSPSQASASPSAIAKPMPRFEPVTTATFEIDCLYNNILIFTEQRILFKCILLQIITNLPSNKLGCIIYRNVNEHTLYVVGCVRTKKFQKVGVEYMNICARLHYIIKYLN